MNSKRKADLQRKLSLAPVARPPAGLVDRLKQDIPTNLQVTAAEEERQRFSSSIRFNLRVAASILLTVSGLYLTLQLISGGAEKIASQPSAAVSNSMPTARPLHPRVTVTPASAPVTASQPMVFALAETTVVARADRSVVRERQQAEAKDTSPGVVAEAAFAPRNELFAQRHGPFATAPAPAMVPPPLPAEDAIRPQAAPSWTVARNAPAQNAPVVSADLPEAPPLAAPPPAEPPMALPPPPTAMAPPVATRMAESRASSGAVYGYSPATPDRDLVKSAKAADLSFAAPESLFGISVDRRAFDRIKFAIEHGQRPETTAINVDALVNYFAGPPQRAPREIRLEAEGSPAPVPGDELRQIVRVTVDTAKVDVTSGGSLPPVAADAVLDVRFDPRTVATHRRIGGNELSSSSERTLLKNASVTALYEIELLPNIQPRQPIATVQLTYRSVTDGREQKVSQTLQRRDLARSWKAATRRHRLASLGAVWGETLKGNAGGLEIARRAEELAHQAPHDEKARELADVAEASSRLHASAAAGSAR
ncbi:MAG: hypothetical protein JWO56_441 [Acidobacteria bacterium]|nr:hypothetical protein [Acidobacteriota bacterium]